VTVDLHDPRTAFLLSLADDDLVMGHRESHWIGVAPSLESDIAFSGISQDEINHADVWYQLLTGGDRAEVDRLGLGRRPEEYRHAVLVERPPGDFAHTLARQFLYDHADVVRLAALTESADAEVAAIARKLAHEERYHVEHADAWFWRIARGGAEPARRLHDALAATWPEALWLFEPTPGEDAIVTDGVLPAPARELMGRWLEIVGAMLDEAGYGDVAVVPDGLFTVPGGRNGVHTRDWTEDVWPEMTDLYRRFEGATW
jgi:ring-1,2-phenylacetyl-CoA epoxidase subunit PaaC